MTLATIPSSAVDTPVEKGNSAPVFVLAISPHVNSGKSTLLNTLVSDDITIGLSYISLHDHLPRKIVPTRLSSAGKIK